MKRHVPKLLESERGLAFVTSLLLLFMTSSLLAVFLVGVVADSRLRAVDKWRTQSFYAAHAALEKLTADLGNLFATDFSPEADELIALQDETPAIQGVEFSAQDGLGYTVEFPTNAAGNPDTQNRTILSGPFQGFIGLVTPYTLTATAHTIDGSETRLQRSVQTVSIPVFQFGIFSETDLSFFAGPDFNFGGRVHTNGNLFLASGATLTLADRVTANKEVVRTNLANGWATSNGYTGNVRAIKAPGNYRNLLMNEGSLVGTLGSAVNEPTWTNLSLGTYNGNVRNGRTGTKQLDLPLITVGGTPVDLIKRPVVGEDPLVTGQRMFAQASVRILLSDTSGAITSLPTVSPNATPIERLATVPIPGYVVDVDHAPLGTSSAVVGDGYRSPVNTPLLGGFLKVEYRDAADTWRDVTLEWLNLGITKRNIDQAGCAEPNPNAIIRLQRVRQTPSTAPGNLCANDSIVETDYWPLALYDTREARARDTMPVANTTLMVSGVMHYIELDVNNFRRWLLGQIGASGANVVNEDGFVIYFSDRRTNRNPGGQETGEYGWEDIVNPGNVDGSPDGMLNTGEDLNSNNLLDNYGGVPVPPAGATAPLTAAATPATLVTMAEARVNRPIFFRRALKLVNGPLGNLPVDGLTVASENPVYVQGNFNANAGGFGEPNAPAAVMADALTLLSNNWNDTRSFQFPNNPAQRPATTTWYRFAVIAGKGKYFPHIGGMYQDYGTDGGVHNFLRYLENWGGQTINYRGSIASFYYNRQAVGIYKCCTNVYSPPTRGYAFDTEFLDPALLPPKTPMFRDVNTTGFVQITRH